MAQLIDSSIFIALERQGRPSSAFAALVPSEPVAMSSITATELLMGVHRAEPLERRTRREAYVEALLVRIPVLPIDIRVARTHARVWAHLAARGQMIGAHDLLIAATALAHGYDLLTDNIREFARVPGLIVRRPAWPA